MDLPHLFIERIQQFFPLEFQNIIDALEYHKKSWTFRLNPSKITLAELQQAIPDKTLSLDPIFPEIFRTEQKHLYTKHPWIFSGTYYFQDLASMLPVLLLNLEPNHMILDACASPGSKSTQIVEYIQKNGGILIANEFDRKRVGRLIENIARWGTDQVIVCNQDTQIFAEIGSMFDKVLIDAPCSGEGMFYKNPESMSDWNYQLVKTSARTQKKIIADVLPSVKEGGEIIYSTCTMSPEENEGVVQWVLDHYASQLELVDISDFPYGVSGLKQAHDIVFHESIPARVKRILPTHSHFLGEAFFMAKFKVTSPILSVKKQGVSKNYKNYWDIPTHRVRTFIQDMGLDIPALEVFALGHFIYHSYHFSKSWIKQFFPLLHPVYAGVRLGILKKDRVEPSIELATSGLLTERSPTVNLSYNQIYPYLLGETCTPSLEQNRKEGYTIVRYNQQMIGFAKILKDGTLKSGFISQQGKKII